MLKSQIATGTSTLMTTGWLRDTPSDFAEAVLAHCHWREVRAGSAVQHAGDIGVGIVGLASGTVAISTSLSAPDAPAVHFGHPGFWFGYVSVFTGAGLPNSILARSDVLLATIARPQLENLLEQHPKWWRYVGLLGIIGANTATTIAADLLIRDSRRRCAASLLRLTQFRFEQALAQCAVEVPLTQDDIAAVTNLSRSTVSAILLEFEQSGLITLGYRSITIQQPDQLHAIVDDA